MKEVYIYRRYGERFMKDLWKSSQFAGYDCGIRYMVFNLTDEQALEHIKGTVL